MSLKLSKIGINNIAVEEPDDVDMEDTQELEEHKKCIFDEDGKNEQLEDSQLMDVKDKKAHRRKAVLKELEVWDLLDLRNPQYVAEYSSSIYINMKKEEDAFIIHKDFLENTEIEERHRRRLVEWLSEVHNKFRLLPETFFITCKLVDLAIQKFGVQK